MYIRHGQDCNKENENENPKGCKDGITLIEILGEMPVILFYMVKDMLVKGLFHRKSWCLLTSKIRSTGDGYATVIKPYSTLSGAISLPDIIIQTIIHGIQGDILL